jgi:anti-sigma-K factor RskA
MNEEIEERLLDLLCKQAAEGLSNEEADELSELERTAESPVDLYSLELTAASIAVTAVSPTEELPAHLKSGILARADGFFSQQRADAAPTVPNVSENSMPAMPVWAWLGWAAAALACIALAINIYQTRTDERVNVQPTPTPIPQMPAPDQMRERLLAGAGDIVRAEWAPGNVKGLAVGGDVVWSDSRQEGYLRFQGLPKNDTSQYTYQLWIFDETQDEKTPIDGGVFDVNAEGEVIIPIDAKLKARGPKAFAVTMEKPGGVMVSKRDRVVSLAAVKPNRA